MRHHAVARSRSTTPHERALALALLQFTEALDRVVADYRPNHLTGYLFELASRYSDFFENCPVLKAETDALRTSRLLLCDLTARTLQLRPQSARHRNRRADVADSRRGGIKALYFCPLGYKGLSWQNYWSRSVYQTLL